MPIRTSRIAAFLGTATCLTAGLGAAPALAQTSAPLSQLTGRLAAYAQGAPAEKLYLHLDRPLYLTGETLWFKVYAVDGGTSQPLPLSAVAYVEVLDREQHPVLQGKVALRQATGQGSFVLPGSLPSGTYTVRAYTSWMKNFAPETYFHTTVSVLNTFTASGAAASAGRDSVGYDVQFFPEGGNLVQGLSSRVAVKVTDRAGKSQRAQGRILNQNGREVGSFGTLHAGMGSFQLTPQAGDAYSAVITTGPAAGRRYPLPRAYAQGYVLRVQDQGAAGVLVSVSSTSSQPETLLLLGQARQKPVVATPLQLLNGQASFVVGRDQLPAGISHFTLFTADQRPLCERLYFRPPTAAQRLTITAQPQQRQFTTRDQVRLQVGTAAAQSGGASLSVAVYRLDSLTTTPTADINSYLWLASDLKGQIEDPGYYLDNTGPDAALAADNLMLTQGWSRFRWEQVLAPTPPTFDNLPELNGPLVRGRLTRRGTTTPVAGVLAYLAAPNRIIRLSNAVSNEQGLVQFETGDFYGPKDIVVQTDPHQDSTAQIEIFSPFSARYAAAAPGGPAVLSRFQADYAKRHFQTQVQNAYFGKYKNRFIPPLADSVAFYGKADETYFLDKYTRFKVLEEVMREYVPGVLVKSRKDGFHFAVVDKINKLFFNENPLVLLDGVPVFNVSKMLAMDPLKIQKLEVVDSHYFHGSTIYSGIVSYTTYKGDLEGFALDPHALVQQYEGMQWQREFYAPRYDTPQARQSRLPDLRNLLYWNPAVRTTGSAATPLEFYTGDQAGRYLVVVQGLADSGLAGSTSQVLEVKPAL